MTIQQCVYHTDIWSVDELKKQLIQAWFSLDQDIIDSAIDQWFKRQCAFVQRAHISNKNLYGRDGRTICGAQCVPKSTSVTLAVDEKTLPMATITGRTDRQSATQYAAPS